MIALSRAAVRQFRLVASKCHPPGRPRAPAPPVQITANPSNVTLCAHLGEVVVAWRMSAPHTGGEGSLIVPLDALERFEGTRTDVVTLEAKSPKQAVARWRERGAAASANLELLASEVDWPAEPENLTALAPEFLHALDQAGRTTERDPGKYASHRIQVRGQLGQLVATDGRQALFQGGFTFPFAEDLLIPAIPAFGSREVAIERALSIGRGDEWFYLVVGPWQFWLAIDRDGRFPDVASAIPKAPPTRLEISEADAQTLLSALARDRRGALDDARTVTLDVGRASAIRLRDDEQDPVSEIALAQSTFHGPEMIVVLDRKHLRRALALVFRELHFASPERPMCAVNGERTYLCATLDPKCALPAGKLEVCRTVGSPSCVTGTARYSPIPDSPRPLRSDAMPNRDTAAAERNGHVEPAPGDLIDPFTEAEALRSALAEAAQRAVRLVAALKQYRRERKTFQAAWSSLRGLNLGS